MTMINLSLQNIFVPIEGFKNVTFLLPTADLTENTQRYYEMYYNTPANIYEMESR
jgi:hypothetical protein